MAAGPLSDGPGGPSSEPPSVAALEQAWNRRQLERPVAAGAVRAWRYVAPAVVLGRAQRAARPALRPVGVAASLEVLDRDAGGGAVLVGPWMLGLSVVLPAAHPLVAGRSVAASYAWLADAFVAVLAGEGVAARAARPDEAAGAPAALRWACFAGVTPPEVLAGGRKLVGLAQRRHRHGVLFVAGLLLDRVPWPLLCAAMAGAIDGAPATGDAVPAPGTGDPAMQLAALTTDLAAAGGDASPEGIDRIAAALVAAVATAIAPASDRS